MFSSCFLNRQIFSILPEVGTVKPVKFTRDSSRLARDELLVISKGDHKLIYNYLFIFLALYCTALAGVVN